MPDTPIEMAVNLTEKERKEAATLYPGATEFVHLHNHTLFSPLDGIATPSEYFSACAELGHPAFSITDHGSIANVPDAYWAAKKNNVKFIPGCEIYFSQDYVEFKALRESDPDFKIKAIRPDYGKDTFTIEDLKSEERYASFRRFRHLSVLAKDMIGYRNLIQMTTEAWKIGFYYKPRIWFEQIQKYHEGLIILSGCLNGPVCHNLRKAAFWGEIAKGKTTQVDRFFNKKKRVIKLNISKSEAAQRQQMYFGKTVEWINKFRNLMGDRFYLELQMPGDEIPFGKEAFRQIAWLAKKLGVKAVISNDCHYLSRPDFRVQKCMMAIDQGLSIDDPNLFHVNSDEQFFKSRAQLRRTFIENGYNKFATLEDFEEYCDNTVELSERCSGFQPDLGPKLPKIPEAEVKLTQIVIQGLKDKGLYDNPTVYRVDGRNVTYREQALIELRRYIEKGFASYFLIIRDLLQHSKGQGWDVGPGRGSAGGSLVCYLIGIHQLDPLKWGLSSVRFMGDSRGGHMLNVKME
jgi:DNA polymerase-3 subunit alpha